MTIDTSPQAVAKLRALAVSPAYENPIVAALCDALEEARAEIERLNAERDMDVMMAENAALNKEIPAAAPPAGINEHAAAQTGEYHYDATKHVIGEHARDWIERNRS